MDLEATVFSILIKCPEVEAYIHDRIWPVNPDQDIDLPYLTYFRSAVNEIVRYVDTGKIAMQDVELSIIIWNLSQKELLELVAAIKIALEAYVGDWDFAWEQDHEPQGEDEFSYQIFFSAIA